MDRLVPEIWHSRNFSNNNNNTFKHVVRWLFRHLTPSCIAACCNSLWFAKHFYLCHKKDRSTYFACVRCQLFELDNIQNEKLKENSYFTTGHRVIKQWSINNVTLQILLNLIYKTKTVEHYWILMAMLLQYV